MPSLMGVPADLRVLFRAPVGPRRGFGHLVRCRSLARALGVQPLLAIRGGQRAGTAARALGCDVIDGTPATVIAGVAPHVVVVDDPIAADARRWIACARKFGCRVVTVHDLGLGACEGDLVVDGSIVRAARRGGPSDRPAGEPKGSPRRTFLRGPDYALLDPVFALPPRAARRPRAPRVLISLGGGPRAHLGYAIATAVRREVPWASIRIAGGFLRGPHRTRTARSLWQTGIAPVRDRDRNLITWTGPLDGLASELAACDVAVVGGGVSLYEACARGVAAVGVPVVASQRPTVRGFVSAGAALGDASHAPEADDVARDVVRLLRQRSLRAALVAQARKLVDGQGAARVAEAIRTAVARSGRTSGLPVRKAS